VLTAWAEWTAAAPDEVTSLGRLLQVPPLPELPDALRGRRLVVVEAAILSDEAEAARLLAPLRELGPEIDTFAQAPATAFATLHMDPPEPVPGIGDTALLDALPPEAIDALLGACGPGSGSPLVSVEVRHLGGALGRAPDGAGALGRCAGDYLLFGVGVLMDPSMSGPLRAALAGAVDAVAPWGRGRRLLNFVDAPADTRTMFDPQAHERLCEIRARVDPEGLLQANHPIPRGA
jgi:hypothetical protein